MTGNSLGQPGHKGACLSLSDSPDKIVEHYPPLCSHCGADLQPVESVSFTRRQEVDIPPVIPIYTEHRSFIKICPSCQTGNRGAFPAHIQSPIQYGVSVETMAVYLSVFQSIPYKRICKLFKDFFRLSLSAGSVDTFLNKFAEKSLAAYECIRKQILKSKVVGSDETGCKVNGKKHWIHVWQTNLLTFIVSHINRGHAVIEKYFPDGFVESVYVSDCWASQLKVPALAHQLCMAHLLRELTNFVENLKSEWSIRMKKLFLQAIELKNKMTLNDYRNPTEEVARVNETLDELLKVDYTGFHSREQAFVKRLIKHRNSIFTFLECPDVPPDNNASERAIRNVKVKTKVSGQFRNKDGKGADRYAKIRSVIDTTNKNGQDIYSALFALANGQIIGVSE